MYLIPIDFDITSKYRAIAFRKPKKGEYYLSGRLAIKANYDFESDSYVILEPIDPNRFYGIDSVGMYIQKDGEKWDCYQIDFQRGIAWGRNGSWRLLNGDNAPFADDRFSIVSKYIPPELIPHTPIREVTSLDNSPEEIEKLNKILPVLMKLVGSEKESFAIVNLSEKVQGLETQVNNLKKMCNELKEVCDAIESE